jgi:DNA-binding NtrC family response regulator
MKKNESTSEQDSILIVEDDVDGSRSVADAMEDAGMLATIAATGRRGLELFETGRFDAVLSDLVLPDIDGMEVLNRIRQSDPDMPVIIMTAYGSVPSSVNAMRAGAYDYITKPLDLDDIQAKVRRAVEARQLRRKVASLHDTVRQGFGLAGMVSQSPAMREVLRQVQTLARTTATVLIQGESGTGKELVARALHVDSPRAAGPFVAVNCGAFAETLLESELFGHEKGAFTGAATQHKGAFERAHGGTLFLDEIGDAPRPVQTKLLRVIEQREVVRVGGHAPVKVDVRLLSATNRNINELVENNEFREDLLYRLKVVTLSLPPLRERKEDIRPLADLFIRWACREHNRRIDLVEPEFYSALTAFNWPGNIRQLRNVIEAAVVMIQEPALRAANLALDQSKKSPTSEWATPEGMTLDQIEREILSQFLRKYDGNRTLTAEKLGLSRRTIQRKIKEHNLPY